MNMEYMYTETKDTSVLSDTRFSMDGDAPRKTFVKKLTYMDADKIPGDNPRKSYRKLSDIFNSLPVHFAGRVRELDSLLAKSVIELHAALVLTIHEISVVDISLLNYLEESDDWENLLSVMRKTIIGFRKDIKKHLQSVTSLVEVPEESKFNINSFINLDSNVINKVTGITDFPIDIKRNLGDVVTILGCEAESRIDHVTPDKPIKVALDDSADSTGWYRG